MGESLGSTASWPQTSGPSLLLVQLQCSVGKMGIMCTTGN